MRECEVCRCDPRFYGENKLVRISQVNVVGFVWKEAKTYKPAVKQYRDEKSGEIIAEVVGSDDPAFDFELIAEYPQRVNMERNVFIRRKPGMCVHQDANRSARTGRTGKSP